MQVKPEQLAQHLNRNPGHVFFVHGSETLIIQECADTIRAHARAQGCSEREVIDINDSGDWQGLLQSAGSMSLFAERKLIEVRLPSGKPGAEGSKTLQEFLQSDHDDILLIVSGKVDKQSMRAKWFTALDKAGAVITVWPVGARDMPRWLGQRLQAAGLSSDREALQLLAERVEGNLLAADQEVEKLKLLADGGRVTVEVVVSTVLDNARYSSFGLADSALTGDVRTAIRTLRGLEAEATAPPVVLWALFRDIALLENLMDDQRRGSGLNQAMKQRGVWASRMSAVQGALARQTADSIQELRARVFAVDACIKGFQSGDPWIKLDQLVLLLALGPTSSSRAPLLR